MSRTSRLLGGRYEIDETLGEGGMATVYRGLDTVLNRPIAVKVLSPAFARDGSFVQRFRREAQSAAAMNHPNIVSVFDTGSDDGTHFIVMELVEGRTLRDVIQQEGPLLPERAAEIAESVAAALAFAHARGIVHRDVKPGNIMITPSGEAKVMDFGIARASSGEPLTQTAAVLGTATYLSPEAAQGASVDHRSDIYSLGIVLYEMLTGEVPFTGDSPVAIAYKHVKEEPVRPSRLNADVPMGLESIVMKALAKNPANRYASATDMQADLQRFLAGAPVDATPLLPPEPTEVITREPRETLVMPPPLPAGPERDRRRTLVIGLIALVVLGLLGLLFFFLARNIIGSPAEATVPNCAKLHLSVEACQSQLEQAGLKADVTRQPNENVPAGIVFRQSPVGGAKVDQGSEVHLFVSEGVEQVEVPNLADKTEDEARAALEPLGLQLVVGGQEPSADVPEGRVVRQSPDPGTMVDKGSSVTITLSSGPEVVAVPDVVCLTVADAQTAVQDRGLQFQVEGTELNLDCPEPDRVAAQTPGPGEEVSPGSAVRVRTSLASPSPSPSVSSSP